MSAPDSGPPTRIASLDLVRGVAVLGILLLNIVGFAMPEAAYFNPAAYGMRGGVDLAAWAVNAVLIDGRMRGLFSFLFGASLLLVAERAEAAGDSAARVHFARMGWLFAFGLAHLFLIWWGDILHHYALVGCVAFAFRRAGVRTLLLVAAGLLGVQFIVSAGLPAAMLDAAAAVRAPHPTPAALAAYQSYADGFGHPSPAAIARELAAYRGTYAAAFAHRWPEAVALPWQTLLFVGPETLAYMLLGMACLRSGLLTGGWSPARYRRWAVAAFALTLPFYAGLCWWAWASGFDMTVVAATALTLSVPLRPVMVVGWACLILLVGRGGGRLTGRLEAAGRMAFSNYLLTSVAATTIFYGYGLGWYGQLSRAELYLVVPMLWAAMPGWSRPWLRRFRYGPLEWLWRGLARGRFPPMRGGAV